MQRADLLLPPVEARLDLHQAHEGTAEAAGIRKTQTRGDVAYPLVGLREQMARRLDAHRIDQFTITGARVGETTLHRAHTDAELASRVLK